MALAGRARAGGKRVLSSSNGEYLTSFLCLPTSSKEPGVRDDLKSHPILLKDDKGSWAIRRLERLRWNEGDKLLTIEIYFIYSRGYGVGCRGKKGKQSSREIPQPDKTGKIILSFSANSGSGRLIKKRVDGVPHSLKGEKEKKWECQYNTSGN